MKILTLFWSFTLVLLTSFQAQTLISDNNSDGCVGNSDLLNLLTEYGQCVVSSCGEAVTYEGYSYSTVQIGA